VRQRPLWEVDAQSSGSIQIQFVISKAIGWKVEKDKTSAGKAEDVENDLRVLKGE
jgi:hypothetical protein